MELPTWLCEHEAYIPPRDRTSFARKNVLRLTALLEHVCFGGGAGTGSRIDRALSCVAAPLRLAGLFALVLMVCLSQSGLFMGALLAVALILAAIRPERALKATFLPALAAAVLAWVLALPALLLGVSSAAAMIRIGIKTFINVGLVLGVSYTVPWNKIASALRVLHLPDVVIFTVDMALKHIEVLGRTSASLSEALMLRSVGAAPRGSATSGAAGVMGMTFLKAYEQGRAMEESMRCRGFSGTYPRPAARGLGRSDAVYTAFIILVITFFCVCNF